MTMQEATFFLLNKLRTIYSKGEASQITDWVMEKLTGSAKVERMLYKSTDITTKEELQLQQYIERLMKHEPVQYVLNEAWFCGQKFYVDNNVLIPRPETEELVEWIINDAGGKKSGARIFEIGTGSGCIAVSLKKKLDKAEIWSCDISEAALNVAKKNASGLNAGVHFVLLDFLNINEREKLSSFDIIVSNPPYIPGKDKNSMQPNVLNHEPHTALFVPDENPLVFYKAIAEFGHTHLDKNGIIYAEIHENLSKEISRLFQTKKYSIEIRKDMQGKNRMIKATPISD